MSTVLNGILGWIVSWFEGVAKTAFVTWIERQWPASTAIVNAIMNILGGGASPAALLAHIQNFKG